MRNWLSIFLLWTVKVFGAAELIPSSEPGWPQFRGPRRDGISTETNLLQTWPGEGPKLLWGAANFGRGFSSPIIVKDRLYITGDVGQELHVFECDLAGKVLWKATNGLAWKDPYPGARSTPTYSGGRIYLENAHGKVVAFNAVNGKTEWTVDVLKEFGGQNITWALSECLLVDDRAVYVTAGGKEASVVALDKKNGQTLWKTPALIGKDNAPESASYVSPILVRAGGKRLIVGCSLTHVYCVDADAGNLLWKFPMPTTYGVLAMIPLLVEDAVFMTAPHGKGGRLLNVLTGEAIWSTSLDTCQGGSIYHDGKIIGAMYQPRKGWLAVNAQSGETIYAQPDFIKGSAVFADNRLYALSEDGWMRLLEPTATEFKSHGQFRLARAQNDAWAHPVVFNGRLYLRYHETLFCYDVSRN